MNNCEYSREDLEKHIEESIEFSYGANTWQKFFADFLEVSSLHGELEGDDDLGTELLSLYLRDSDSSQAKDRMARVMSRLESLRAQAVKEYHDLHCSYGTIPEDDDLDAAYDSWKEERVG